MFGKVYGADRVSVRVRSDCDVRVSESLCLRFTIWWGLHKNYGAGSSAAARDRVRVLCSIMCMRGIAICLR